MKPLPKDRVVLAKIDNSQGPERELVPVLWSAPDRAFNVQDTNLPVAGRITGWVWTDPSTTVGPETPA